MTPLLVPMLQTWAEIRTDVAQYWYIYVSMPFIAAFIGYVTKLLALEMLYRPVEFKGIGPLGWQGIVPRRAGKVAAITIDLLQENILKPEELLDRIDVNEALDDLREPLTDAVDHMARQIAEQVRPGAWDSLPDVARQAVIERVRARAPMVIDNLMTQIRANMDQIIDIRFLTVTTLVREKERLNELMRRTGGSAMAFVRRSGVWFGFAIGLVQMVAWAWIHNFWIMPVFGFITGFVSDWLALNMLFRPRQARTFLGIKLEGVLQAKRDEITADYAEIMATDLFAPSVLFEAIITGPGSDRLFAIVGREISAAIDQETGAARPVVQLAIGTKRYQAMKESVSAQVLSSIRVGDEPSDFEKYAAEKLAVEELLAGKMDQMSNDEFEAVMRPVFKDDEWLLITVGAILGGLVGELQVQMIRLFI